MDLGDLPPRSIQVAVVDHDVIGNGRFALERQL